MRSRSEGGSAGGFTLLEMLVVVVVLGLALALILGRMPRRSSKAALHVAAERVQGALRVARSEAIAGDHMVGVTFYPGAGTFSVDGATAVRLPRGAAIAGPTGDDVIRVAFAPDGSGAGGPILLSAGTSTEMIRVDWLTGRVRAGDEESTH